MAKISTFVLFCEEYALDALKTIVRMIFDRLPPLFAYLLTIFAPVSIKAS